MINDERSNKNPFITFGSPSIHEAEIEEVVAVMESGWLGTGPRVAQFEKAFSEYKGVMFTAAVNSCTAALHLSMLAANLQPGDEVITTPLTFCATVNAIIHANGVPVLADIDPDTFNINPAQVEARITPKTKAILPVHFAGRPCRMDHLCALADTYGLKMIEDCAHAIETEYHGKKAGTFGNFACFSFYVTKNVITGEGGMVIARSEEDIADIKILGLHGMSKDAWKRFSDEGYKHYSVVKCGYKYNMTDLQAAIGIHQLKRVERNWLRRQSIWLQYNDAFSDLPIGLPLPPEPDTRHAYHLYTIMLDEEKTVIRRDAFLNDMTKRNIGVGVHYLSIAEHPYYQKRYSWKPEDYPCAMKIGRQTVSIPLSPKLTDADVAKIITTVREILGHN
jgi:dTDP-4-amino-4,6-dideoxygalactose transaminase